MKKTFTALSISFFTLSLLIVSSISAQTGPPSGSVTNPAPTPAPPPSNISIRIENPFRTGNTLFDLAQTIVNNIILPIGGVLAVLAFIYSGFLYVTAQGNQTKIDTAHRALLYTSIGTAVLLGSWVLANVIKGTISQLM